MGKKSLLGWLGRNTVKAYNSTLLVNLGVKYTSPWFFYELQERIKHYTDRSW